MVRIAIIGFGKIARDQHVPAIAQHVGFTLVAAAGGRAERPAGLVYYADHRALIDEARGTIDAVAICTPPGPRHAIARDCLAAGLDVLLEKPPTATVGEVDALVEAADTARCTLFAAWHSQFAPAVEAAAAALAGKKVRALTIHWHEDVNRWHPGQNWVFSTNGFGVFDPGINALSIATRILAAPLLVSAATLMIPANRQAPIAARIELDGGGSRVELDWRARTDLWSIRVEIEDGSVVELLDGGKRLSIDGVAQPLGNTGEYPALYAHFASLIRTRASDVDREPLRIVADAFLVGARETVAPFEWSATA